MREIVPLPEITPLEETPAYIIGVANFHGRMVPILDLNRRFGHSPQSYHLNDAVVILEHAGDTVGLLVNEVRNVREVASEEILPLPSYGSSTQPDARFLTGLIPSGDQIVMLLALEKLLHGSDLRTVGPIGEESVTSSASDARCPEAMADGLVLEGRSKAFFPDATSEERSELRERARSLAQPLEMQEPDDLLSLVVVRLAEEYFAIRLRTIREFAELSTVTPVPCCPKHVTGLMNLRGDLITVLEITGSLGLLPAREQSKRKVVVLKSAELAAGVLVDDVLDVLAVSSSDIMFAPTNAEGISREYLQGTLMYGTRMLSLIDLNMLLTQQSLIVNENL